MEKKKKAKAEAKCLHKIGCLSCHFDEVVECSHCGKEWVPIEDAEAMNLSIEEMKAKLDLAQQKTITMLSMVEALTKTETSIVRGVWRSSRDMNDTLDLMRDYTIELVKAIHKNSSKN